MIIPVFHVITSQYPIVDSTAMEPGMVVDLNSTGYAIKGTSETTGAVGLSADKNRPAIANEWQNRVSDMGTETAASGVLSVYHSGGEFWVDVDDEGVVYQAEGSTAEVTGVLIAAALAIAPSTRLACNGSGQLKTYAGSGTAIALALASAQELTTGIPGEFEPGASFPLADDTDNRNFVKIKLLI